MSERLTSQTQVLEDVRRALGRMNTLRPAELEPFVEASVGASVEELVARFSTELTAVGGYVYRIGSDKLQFVDDAPNESDPVTDDLPGKSVPGINKKLKFVGQVADRIAAICESLDATELALSGSDLLAEMTLADQLTARGRSLFVPDETLPHEQLVSRLAGCGAGLTAVEYAIAETGTLVLSSDESNALLVSLLPPIHIALLKVGRIRASLDEVIRQLAVERIGRVDPSRSVSFITGPSRTSDVELTLSIGVHGPKELHVIILDE
jgi:L-lactate utilization protein LutC